MRIRCLSVTTITAFLGTWNPANAQPDELVVTAQKREQNIHDVPIAISAFDSETLHELNITSLQDVTNIMPNVELFDDRGAGQPTWVIRGVGLADFNSNNTPTAAIYNDEVYLVSNSLGGVGLFDIERVEVLKGPQGGLYGRNTTGGAVRVLSNRPDLQDYDGYAQASYGKWSRKGLEGAFGGPITEDTLAFRISASIDQGGGWQDSLATVEDDKHGDSDFQAFRGQVLYKPTSELELLFKADVGSNQSETVLGRSSGVYDPLTGDFCAQLRAGQRNDSTCVGLQNLFGNTILPSNQTDNGTVVLANPINALDNDWTGYSLNANYDLGFAKFVSISSQIDFNYIQFFDFDATPLEFVSSTDEQPDTNSNIEQWSQEIRLISSTEGPLTWLAGAAYAKDTINQVQGFSITDLESIFDLNLIKSSFMQDTKSLSIYADFGYDFSNALKVNGSLRFTDEDKKIDYASIGGATGAGIFPLLSDIRFKQNLDANVSGHFGLDWRIQDDALLYAKYARGFKSGGFSGAFTDDANQVSPYKEETNDAFEIGLKSNLIPSLQFNLAAFYYHYQDVQGFASVENAIFGNITKLTNLGDAEHIGLELDTSWTPSQIPGFSLELSGAWLHTEITNSTLQVATQDNTLVNIEGLDRNFAPEFSFSANIQQETRLSKNLSGRVSAVYKWRDNLTTRSSQLSELDFGLFRQDSYGLLNLRASIAHLNQKWELSILGENITDKVYTLRATTDDGGSYQDLLGSPSSWKVQVRYSF